MSTIKHGVYHGPVEALQGRSALVKYDEDDDTIVWAQFDDKPLYVGGQDMCQGWHQFGRRSFTLDDDGIYGH